MKNIITLNTSTLMLWGQALIIQNGGPKGGAKYAAPNGEVYNYAIFWTRLINGTTKPVKLNIVFPVNPKESNGFFVIVLCLAEGAHGTMRTGLNLKGQNLFYSVKIDGSKSNTKSDDKEIQCGSINLQNLVLSK